MGYIIITDLDGTLYNTEKRGHLAQQGLWDEFHKASINDEPNYDVLETLRQFYNLPYVTIVAITGRPKKYQNLTYQWMRKHEILVDALCMRENNDFKPDVDVKIEIAEKWIGGSNWHKKDVLFALEDRDVMVDAWRAWGINCWQVRPSSY